ncbi:MAG: hypothetical protein AMJ69_07200 [Gammaproteobacteria bacterium SG8_47]|nr:MAG: hypothetical protein AMJ69_07200 [Gammaproteobacteria bacterium SG8_47]
MTTLSGRRAFLRALAAGVLLVEVGACEREAATPATARIPAWLLEAVGERTAAARIGRDYLLARPDEANVTVLLDRIDAALTHQGKTAVTGSAPDFALLDGAVRSDYAENNVVSVRGWILSSTEVRVYALLALAPQT